MKKILFVIQNEVTRRSTLPVLKQFINNGYDCRLLVTKLSAPSLRSFAHLFSNRAEVHDQTWDLIISANPLDEDKFKGKRVSIPHGSMFGNSAWSLNSACQADLHFGISPNELVYIKSHLKDNFNENKFIPSGNPANDYLIRFPSPTSSNYLKVREDLKRSLGLNHRKTILLSSHWTSIGNLRTFGTGLLEALSWSFPNHQVICTCHPALLTSPQREFQIDRAVDTPDFDAQWLIKALRSKEDSRIKIIFNKRIADLMFVSDIFIGDNSSSLVEAAFFNLPLVLRNANLFFDKNISKIIIGDGHIFSNVEELIGNIKRVEQSDRNPAEINNEIKKQFLYNVGNSAKTIFEKLHYHT